jgi:hypothetical protein
VHLQRADTIESCGDFQVPRPCIVTSTSRNCIEPCRPVHLFCQGADHLCNRLRVPLLRQSRADQHQRGCNGPGLRLLNQLFHTADINHLRPRRGSKFAYLDTFMSITTFLRKDRQQKYVSSEMKLVLHAHLVTNIDVALHQPRTAESELNTT